MEIWLIVFILLDVIFVVLGILSIVSIIKNNKLNKALKEQKDKKKNARYVGALIVSIIILIVTSFFTYVLIDNIVSSNMLLEKPIIYIYPTEDTEVNVKLTTPEIITHSYPKYNNGWNLKVSKNGNIIDKNTNKSYYALYWEGKKAEKINMKEGFVVKGEDTIEFLEDKLKILGLNDREINEFIIYWLPKMENNNYNFIHFKTEEEINEMTELEILPKPDTLIRVYMDFKALEKPIDITRQELKKVTRTGYTLVEWGGSSFN